MKTKSPNGRNKMFLFAIFLLTLLSNGFAQNPSLKVFEEWRDTVGSQNTFYKATTITIPGTTHILVCGATLNSNGDYDMLVQKLDGTGAVLWSQQYDGAGHGDDIAADVAVNTSTGDVYITGCYYEDATDSSNAITIMYSSSGVQQWVSTHNGTGSQFDATIALLVDDSNGDVFAAGLEWSGANLYDMLLIKYDNTGAQQWVSTLDYANGNDGLNKIGMSLGKPYAGGGVQDVLGSYEYAVLGFDMSSGGLGVSTSHVGTTPGFNRLADLVVDDTGNVYITGFTFDPVTKYNIRTIKLDTNLSVVWSWDYDAGYNMDDEGTGIALDSHNNVIVVGYSETVFNGKNYTIIKYNSAGSLQWMRDYDDPDLGDDSASAVIIGKNDTDAIYVTGYSFNGSTNDYWTMKLDGQGNQVWGIGMNSLLNGDDKATAIALDSLGDVIVSGQNKIGDSVFAYTTVKYMQKNVLLPQDTIPFTSSSFVFTENRGQLMGTDTAQHPEVKYYTMHGSPQVYFMDTAVSYVFAKLDTTPGNDSLVRVDMKFVNSNPDQKIRSMDEREDYLNFFLPQVPEGRSRVPNYNQLVSFNVWNNVDILYGSNLSGLKYYFVCKPGGGGNPAVQIDLYYEGADSVKIDGSGQLIIYTPLGNIVQARPAAWQIDAGGNYQPLGWQPSYVMLGINEVGFTSFGAFNTALPLIIAVDRGNTQPQSIANITWSTYYGAGGNGLMGEFNDVRVDPSGNVLVCGYSNAMEFPVLNQIQVWDPLNGYDATVVKFHPSGERMWATYYGGSVKQDGNSGANDNAISIDVDKGGTIFFTGSTQSYTDLSLQSWGSAYFQDTNLCVGSGCADVDAFIVRISADGQFISWATYYGGPGLDQPARIRISPINDDVYVAGVGAAGFPLDSSQALWNSTNGTGWIARFDATGTRLWSTKIGSSSSPIINFRDAVTGLSIDKNGDVVICGQVVDSLGFPVVQNVCADSSNNVFAGGATDCFVTKFTGNTNDLVWSTFYGSSLFEYPGDIVCDSASNYYMTGLTQLFSGNPVPLVDPGAGAYFQNSYGGANSDAFIAEFDQNGCLVWSTFYGGSGIDEGFSVAVDSSCNLFVIGTTNSSNIPFAFPNLGSAYVDNSYNAWGTDAYISCFQANTHQQIWTTYFGSDIWHPTASATYQDSTLYMVGGLVGHGQTTANFFPLDNGGGPPVWFQDTVGGWTGFITRFDINPSIVDVPENESPDYLNLNVFPNPSDGTLWIQGPIVTGEDIIIEVFNVNGQLTYTESLSQTNFLNRQISLAGYGSGMYIVQVRSGDKVFNKKVLIQK